MPMLRSHRVAPRAATAVCVAGLLLSSCGGQAGSAHRALTESEYRTVVKRGCVAAKRAVEQASSAAPEVYLRRAAEASDALQSDFAALRPPARFVALHRESLRLGEQQLAVIRASLERLHGGQPPAAFADLQARNRTLLQRGNELAEELGVPECVNELGPA